MKYLTLREFKDLYFGKPVEGVRLSMAAWWWWDNGELVRPKFWGEPR